MVSADAGLGAFGKAAAAAPDRGPAGWAMAEFFLVTVVQVAVQVRFNSWGRDFCNARESRDGGAFRMQILIVLGMAAMSVAVVVYTLYLKSLIQIANARTPATSRTDLDWLSPWPRTTPYMPDVTLAGRGWSEAIILATRKSGEETNPRSLSHRPDASSTRSSVCSLPCPIRKLPRLGWLMADEPRTRLRYVASLNTTCCGWVMRKPRS